MRLPFHKIHEDPSKNYGVHGLDLFFILSGPHGAVQFLVNFPAYLTETYQYWDSKGINSMDEIIGFDVGYHSPKPMWNGHDSLLCDVLKKGKCYYYGSSLEAHIWVEEIFRAGVEEPEKLIWSKLKEEYRNIFLRGNGK